MRPSVIPRRVRVIVEKSKRATIIIPCIYRISFCPLKFVIIRNESKEYWASCWNVLMRSKRKDPQSFLKGHFLGSWNMLYFNKIECDSRSPKTISGLNLIVNGKSSFQVSEVLLAMYKISSTCFDHSRGFEAVYIYHPLSRETKSLNCSTLTALDKLQMLSDVINLFENKAELPILSSILLRLI